MKCFLVDFGSTFIKYSIFDTVKNNIIEENKIPFPEPNICDEINFTVSYNDLCDVIDLMFCFAKENKCKKIFISVQMHGYLLKYPDGKFSDYISWRDKSGNTENLSEYNIDFFTRGTSLKNNLPFVKLFSQKEKLSECEFFTLGSFISYKLTNFNASHKTDACASGFYNAETLNEDTYPIENLKLPINLNDISVVGIKDGIEIYSPCGDHQVTFLGIDYNDFCLVNIGTATQISCLSKKSIENKGFEKRPYFDNKHHLITVSGLIGGDILYKSQSIKNFSEQIINTLQILPKKKLVVFSGGGADSVFEKMSDILFKKGYTCVNFEKNAGMEGLKKMAMNASIKLGTMISEIPFMNLPLIFKNNNLDFFVIDNEHGSFDYSVISGIITNAKLCGIDAIIRLSDNSRMNITKFSDMGASGFILPMTNSVDDILPLINYAKYAPIGKRGISTMRAHTLYNPPPLSDYIKQANENMKIYAQIETVKGVENIEEILSLNGLDGIFIGPNDLSCDLDCIGDNAPVTECINKVASACQKSNKPWGIITTNKELIKVAKENGVNIISYGSELNMINNGCKTIKEKINNG